MCQLSTHAKVRETHGRKTGERLFNVKVIRIVAVSIGEELLYVDHDASMIPS